jgi:tRNA G18 (ribose-2'-O)-methylase SpoU
LTGITSTPNQTKVIKTALGAEENVAWTYRLNGLESIEDLKSKGYRIWAIENNLSGESLFNIKFPLQNYAPILIVIGNEIAGIDPGILKLCDRILYLPMLGIKRSLNVVIAFGIVAYYLRFGDQASLA